MRAIIENKEGKGFELKEVSNPTIKENGVIIKVLAAHIVPFAKEVLNGELGFFFPQDEFIPGTNGIGIVEELGKDVHTLEVGDLVFCDGRVVSGNKSRINPDGILIGWTGLSAEGYKMQQIWKNGTFAEKAIWPQEALTKIPTKIDEVERFACLNYLNIAYGGLLKGELRPGQTVLINGGTGGIGAAATLVALAMGASKIVITGSNEGVMSDLVKISPNRIVAINMKQDFESYKKELISKTNGADMVLDVLGNITNTKMTEVAIETLNDNKSLVCMGGVSEDIKINYAKLMLSGIKITGNFMYPRTAPAEVIKMIESGLIDLNHFRINRYTLDTFNEAIDKVKTHRGLEVALLLPN